MTAVKWVGAVSAVWLALGAGFAAGLCLLFAACADDDELEDARDLGPEAVARVLLCRALGEQR